MSTEDPLVWRQSRKAVDDKLSFLDLPREIRDIIYELLYRVPGVIFIHSKPTQFFRHVICAKNIRGKRDGPIEPIPLGVIISTALMRTCRQIHAECSPILYGNNDFQVYNSYMQLASVTYRPLVRHITHMGYHDARLLVNDPFRVSHVWKALFWPYVLQNVSIILTLYPKVRDIRFQIYAPLGGGHIWKPPFVNFQNTTPEERINMASNWLLHRCPFGSERHRECLHLEFAPPPLGSHSQADIPQIAGWDISEFAIAFDRMKLIQSKTNRSLPRIF
ncbi:hypothetical protein K432DRAFT_447132 [Lepidopterella palustris CBS 459.81]|uniref:DUF7730 domain-containing protein n=1 Tax=Lepidopterella palustris CBS 459.81 TaxID=1314670 RepID=A0A8E2J9T7_9PEZI|nr:hypothetical protein K432DRAFT_447132 [Lepidopterella palustris CBS 459.81]